MANRYAVATGSWGSTAVWSATSGGAPGASVPGGSDAVFFDANSGAITVTLTGSSQGSCASLDCTGFTGTLTGNAATNRFIIPGGSAKLTAGMSLGDNPPGIRFSGGTPTLTSAGHTIRTLNINPSVPVTLADDLATVANVEVNGGTLDFNDKNAVIGTFLRMSDIAPVLTLGSGLIEIRGSGAALDIRSGTVNAETSTLSFTNSSTSALTFAGNGHAYYRVEFAREASTGTITISGSNTFSEFADLGTAAHDLRFNNDTAQTFLSAAGIDIAGSSGNRITLRSSGTSTHTLSCASGSVNCDWLVIQNSAATGGAFWLAGDNSIDNGGNTGWIFEGAQELTGSLYADQDTFHTPSIGRGAVGLTPTLYSDADTFHAAVLASSYDLAPALYTDADTFFEPTVAAGAVDLAPGLYADPDTFYSPDVDLPGHLAPDLYQDPDTFYAPAVQLDLTILEAETYVDQDTFHAATVASGNDLIADLFVDSDTFHAATAAPGAVAVAPPLLVDGDTFGAASVAFGLSAGTYSDPDTIYSATVSPGAVGVVVPLYTDADQFHPVVVAFRRHGGYSGGRRHPEREAEEARLRRLRRARERAQQDYLRRQYEERLRLAQDAAEAAEAERQAAIAADLAMLTAAIEAVIAERHAAIASDDEDAALLLLAA